MQYQPYTYLIKFKTTGQLYYGAKTAKGCHPCQLWVRYFTSSKIVKKLIKEYGKESFEIISIKLHETKEDCLKWEELYLISVNGGYNPQYLNRHNGSKNWTRTGMSGENNGMYGKHHTEKTCEQISKSHIGKHHTEETKKLMRENSPHLSGENHPVYGKKHSEEQNKKFVVSHSGEKHWAFGKFGENSPNHKKYIITFPDGHEEVIIGLNEFCRNNNLQSTNMIKVAKGIYKYHKGFKCRYYIEEALID